MSTTRETIPTCYDEITPMSMVTMYVTDCHKQLKGMDFPNSMAPLIEYEGFSAYFQLSYYQLDF